MHLLAAALPGFLRLGSTIRLPVYGLFAAAGVVAALALSQPAARRLALPSEKIWDAGIFIVAAALISSRLLLIAFNFHAFLRFPTLVLSLPSLTYTGLLLTAIATVLYLRLKHLPILRAADAFSPGACALAAILAIAHFLDGTAAGMPTRQPWGILSAGDTMLGRTHPVQLFAAALWIALGLIAWRLLQHSRRPGLTAAFTLAAAGLFTFTLGFLSQPAETFGDALLDQSQWLALGLFALGAFACITLAVPLKPETE